MVKERGNHLPLGSGSSTEETERRVKIALKGLTDGKMTDIEGATIFFKYFFLRLKPMYRDTPKIANTIEKALQNQQVGLIVPNVVDVVLQINTINDLQFKNGVTIKTPSLVFEKLQVIEEVLLGYATFPEMLIAKKLRIKKLGKILKWMAPIAAIQTEEMLQKVYEEDVALMATLLEELGY